MAIAAVLCGEVRRLLYVPFMLGAMPIKERMKEKGSGSGGPLSSKPETGGIEEGGINMAASLVAANLVW